MAKIKTSAKKTKMIKHSRKTSMEKVKIKRAKRAKKKVSAKEKVLAGLGLGSTLLGGAGMVKPPAKATQFVRTQNQEEGSATGKVKKTLNKIFGVEKAKANYDETDAYAEAGGSGTVATAAPQAGDTKQSDDGQYTLVFDGSTWNPAPGSSRQSSGGNYVEYWDVADNAWYPANGAVRQGTDYEEVYDVSTHTWHPQNLAERNNGTEYYNAVEGKWLPKEGAVTTSTPTPAPISTPTPTPTPISTPTPTPTTTATNPPSGNEDVAPIPSAVTPSVGDSRLNSTGEYLEYYDADGNWYPANGAVRQGAEYEEVYDIATHSWHPQNLIERNNGTEYYNAVEGQWLPTATAPAAAPSNATDPGAAVVNPVISGTQGYNSATGDYTSAVSSGNYLVLYGNFAPSGNVVKVNGQVVTPDFESDSQININLGNLSGSSASVTVTTPDGATASKTVAVSPATQAPAAPAAPTGGVSLPLNTASSLTVSTNVVKQPDGSFKVTITDGSGNELFSTTVKDKVELNYAAAPFIAASKQPGDPNYNTEANQKNVAISQALIQTYNNWSNLTVGQVIAQPASDLGVWADQYGNRAVFAGEFGGELYYDASTGNLILDKGDGKPVILTGNPDYNQTSVSQWTQTVKTAEVRGGTAGPENQRYSEGYNLLTELGIDRDANGENFPTQYTSSAVPNTAVPKYNVYYSSSEDGTHTTYTFRITMPDGTELDKVFFSPEEIGDFLRNNISNYNSPNDLLSAQDRALYKVLVDAQAKIPSLSKELVGFVPYAATGHQIVWYQIENGVMVKKSIPVNAGALSTMEQAQELQKMFPDSEIVEGGYNIFPGATVVFDPADPRRNYLLKLPDGSYVDVAMFLRNMNWDGNQYVISVMSGNIQKQFQPPADTPVIIRTIENPGDYPDPATTIHLMPGGPQYLPSQDPAVITQANASVSAVITHMDAFDKDGNNSNGVVAPGYTIEVGGTGLSVYDKFSLVISGQEFLIQRSVITNNKITLTVPDNLPSTLKSGSAVRVKLVSKVAGEASGVMGQVLTYRAPLAAQENIADLDRSGQRQLQDSQPIGGSSGAGTSSVVGGGGTGGGTASNTQGGGASGGGTSGGGSGWSYSSGGMQSYGSADSMANFKGLQMPPGYPASAPSAASDFNGLKMPPSYPASGGLQMPSGYPASQVQGVDTQTDATTYVIKKGDTLWNISKKYYGDGKHWRKILAANPRALSRPGDVRSLKAGAELVIPKL